MKYYKFLPAFFLLTELFFFYGCNFFSRTETAEFIFSRELMEENPEVQWKAVYFDCYGNECTEKVLENRISIEVNKNSVTPVLLYKIQDTENLENPKGAIYPYSMEVSEKNGFASEILFILLRGSYEDFYTSQNYLSHFNWPRFMSECEKSENPWNFDKEKIARKIATRSLRKSDLK